MDFDTLNNEVQALLIKRHEAAVVAAGKPTNSVSVTVLSKIKDEFNLVGEPGDSTWGTNKQKISMSAPIAADLWYLFNYVNMLTWVNPPTVEQSTTTTKWGKDFFDKKMTFFKDKFGDMRPMKGINIKTDVTLESINYWWINNGKGEWKNNADYFVQLLAFEIGYNGQSFKPSSTKIPENTVGTLMFPIGQLGVMEVISILRETESEVSGFTMQDDVKPYIDNSAMFPPHVNWEKDKCYGRHLIESGYKVPDVEKLKVFLESRQDIKTTTEVVPYPLTATIGEDVDGLSTVSLSYLAKTMTRAQIDGNRDLITTSYDIPIEDLYGCALNADGTWDSTLSRKVPTKDPRKGWMRVWITREEKWPVPGEFVGVLIKPSPVPPHVWWYQDSSPLIYAGNWMDTFDLTSGMIIAKAENATAVAGVAQVKITTWTPTGNTVVTQAGGPIRSGAGALCTGYRVKIHGEEIDIYPSDFLEYDVGTRVGIYKVGTRSETLVDGRKIVFDHIEQRFQGDPVAHVEPIPAIHTDTLMKSTKYAILPITFFQ
jgi:hypothetical protein